MSNGEPGWFKRPQLERTTPNRSAGNYYRSAADGGKAIGGIPLDSTEAAVTAAVRMAYKVAEAQIERSARLARRLREAGDKAVGPRSDRQALDGTERLIFRGAMALLGWIEGAASDRSSNPLKRLAVAQYRLLGSLLGLVSPDGPRTTTGDAPDGTAPVADGARSGAPADRREKGSPPFPLGIKHVGKERRPVHITGWAYAGDLSAQKDKQVTFYHVEGGAKARPLVGKIVIEGRRTVRLELTTTRATAAGRWMAALCDEHDVQVGHIEITL